MNAALPGTAERTPGLVVVRGAGDIATGVIQKLAHAGFAVVALEVAQPMAIRWRAALSPAVERGRWEVEDLVGVRAGSWAEALALLPGQTRSPHRAGSSASNASAFESSGDSKAYARHVVPVLVDPEARLVGAEARLVGAAGPVALVDAILAKRNVGTHRGMAPITVGLGPGFSAGVDVDYVVETMRGHDLGRVIVDGPARPNTGVPGPIAGRAAERVLHAPASGQVAVVRGIGSVVRAGEVVCTIASDAGPVNVLASIDGVVRGMIPDGYRVPSGLKIADIDPRVELAAACDTISDKSRAVGGGALDAVLQGLRRTGAWGLR